jgi:hypothetical protein
MHGVGSPFVVKRVLFIVAHHVTIVAMHDSFLSHSRVDFKSFNSHATTVTMGDSFLSHKRVDIESFKSHVTTVA